MTIRIEKASTTTQSGSTISIKRRQSHWKLTIQTTDHPEPLGKNCRIVHDGRGLALDVQGELNFTMGPGTLRSIADLLDGVG